MSAPASAHAEVRPASSYGNGGASVRGKRKYDKKDHSSADGAGADGAKRFKHGGGADSWKKKGGAGSYKKPIALTRKDRDQQKRDRKAQKPNADIIAEANKVSSLRTRLAVVAMRECEKHAHLQPLLSIAIAHDRQRMRNCGASRHGALVLTIVRPRPVCFVSLAQIWQTSFTTISAGERAAHITSLLSHMSGKMHEVGLKHDASRAIQLAIKYANEEQKHTIVNQLTGHFKQLSEEHYGHYIIIKMLSNDTKRGTAKAACLKEFKTHINKVSRPAHGLPPARPHVVMIFVLLGRLASAKVRSFHRERM
jgi:hypothetical protein